MTSIPSPGRFNGSAPNAINPGRKPLRGLRRDMPRALLAALLCGAASAAPPPPPVDPASQEHHVGKVIFVELVTPDLAAAKQFYAGLFGWSFSDSRPGTTGFAEASLDGRPVAALVQKKMRGDEKKQPAWLTFIAVRDVDAAQKTALLHGARLLSAAHDVADRGREAVLADPQGAVFAVLASSRGDPPDVLAAPGEWIWSSLFAGDADADAAFYQTLFDYEVFDLPADGSTEHLILASDDYARASANAMPATAAHGHSHWLNYVRVDDAAQVTARVVALGGRVLVAPRVDRHGGRVAVVADPQGAPFGLLEWSDAQTRQVAP